MQIAVSNTLTVTDPTKEMLKLHEWYLHVAGSWVHEL